MILGDSELGSREDREYWRINGNPVATDPIDEVRTFETLEVTFHVPLEVIQETLRPLRRDAGAFNVLERSDGGFVAVDVADGNNTHTVEAPASRQSVRRQVKWLVADYDEEMLDRSGEKYEVELELVPARSKRQYSGHDDTVERDDDEWLFEFDAGPVATGAVSAEILETATEGVETIGLDLVLGGPQVRKLEESARRLLAAQVNDQFDGGSIAEDNSPGMVNTLQLDPPEGGDKTVDPGHYVVDAWSTEWMSSNVYEVSMDVMAIDPPITFDPAAFSSDFETIRSR